MITQATRADKNPTPVLVVLFVGAFVMGCAEMLVVGMLDLIAGDLSVSVSTAGTLVTANALGLAIGGPSLTFLTTRFNRRPILLGSVAVFVVANLLPTLGAGYQSFLIARVLIGAVQGLFIAAAMVTATSIVPPERSGRAMALVISGFATSSALGLPLGTLLGLAIGWRGSFAAVTIIAAVVLVAAFAVLPSVPTSVDSLPAGQARHAFAPRVLALLALCCLIFVAIQSALTYLVPYLNEVTGISGASVSVFLLAYGVATTLGSYAGGRFADSNARRTLLVGTIGVTVSLLAMYVFGALPTVVAMAVLGIGLFGMGMAPSLQLRVNNLAGPGAPLAASLPASAVNAGIAIGSLTGGVAINHGLSFAGLDLSDGPQATVLAGAIVSGIAILAAWASNFIYPAAIAAGPVR